MEMYPTVNDENIEFSDEVIDVASQDDGINMMIDSEAEEMEEAEEDLTIGLAEFETEGSLIPDSVVDKESDNTDDIANNDNNEGE